MENFRCAQQAHLAHAEIGEYLRAGVGLAVGLAGDLAGADVVEECRAEVEHLVKQRLAREAKVVAGLEQTGPADLDTLVALV